ncbi:MAG: hypothetical protein JOY58_06445 [Solirubrobacterales bacterium]|nr:hypothetical protein [Solirubrobacterales bacterium]MBV9047888.1 hypothetical protein [Solirubrobacterales bacterium]
MFVDGATLGAFLVAYSADNGRPDAAVPRPSTAGITASAAGSSDRRYRERLG